MGALIDALAGAATGLLSGLGLGGGTLLMIYMTWFGQLSQRTAQGINLLYFLPSASGALVLYIKNKQIEYKTALFTLLGGIPAAILAAFVALSIDEAVLRQIFSLVLIFLGIRELTAKGKQDKS